MKILFAQNIVGISGSENYFLQLIPKLREKGIEVEFLCFYPFSQRTGHFEFTGKLEVLGVKIHTLGFNRIPGFDFFFKLKRILKLGNYHLIHTHLIHADFFLAVLKLFFIRNIKIVSTKHGYEESYINDHGFDLTQIKKKLYYHVARYSEKQICRSSFVSLALMNMFIKSGICNSQKTDLIYNGLNYPEIKTLNNTLRHSPFQIVMASRLIKSKGHRFAFEAVRILSEKYPDIILLVIGSGNLKKELEQLAQKLGIKSHILFLGYKDNVREYMAMSDIVLFPSVSEGFGLVSLEAFSVKKPVVAFDVPALNEIIIHKETGLLAQPYDTFDLSNKIDQLFSDQLLYQQITENAYQRLLNYYNLERMAGEIILFYNKAINEKEL